MGYSLWGRKELDITKQVTHTQIGHSFSSKEQVSFNFMAAVTVFSDFGAKKKKINLSLFPLFHSLSPLIYLYFVSSYWIMNGFKYVLYMMSSMFTFICSDNRLSIKKLLVTVSFTFR